MCLFLLHCCTITTRTQRNGDVFNELRVLSNSRAAIWRSVKPSILHAQFALVYLQELGCPEAQR